MRIKSTKFLLALLFFNAVALPGLSMAQQGQSLIPQPRADLKLPGYFDCLRNNSAALVSAHRMGPSKGFPENSIETMAYTTSRAPVAVETDVRMTKDGALVLLHDASLERTTTGSGLLAEKNFAELKDIVLKDNLGAKTPFELPSLARALERALELNVIVQLDIKEGVPFALVTQAVAQAQAYNHVIIIVYSIENAIRVHQLDPNIMISLTLLQAADLDRLKEARVDLSRILGFIGTNNANPGLSQALASAGIETILGTLGRPGKRLDDLYLADGDGSEYPALTDQGVQVIATDFPIEAYKALQNASKTAALCRF
jgi:glycerophosphoryl diester phosphodiesterase